MLVVGEADLVGGFAANVDLALQGHNCDGFAHVGSLDNLEG